MKRFIAVLAMSSLAATPALGSVRDAAFSSSADRPAAQTSVFAGATYRVGLDRRAAEARGRASLKVAGMSNAPGSPDFRFGNGLEITAGRTGKPAVHLAGQDIGQLNRKAQLSGTTTALIVGGVLIAAAVTALVLVDYTRDRRRCEDDSEQC